MGHPFWYCKINLGIGGVIFMKVLNFLIVFFCLVTSASAFDGFSMGYGSGINGESVSNLRITKNLSDKYYYEIGISTIEENVFLFSASPMIRFESSGVFCEFGIGISSFSDTVIGDRDLSTHLLFEDKMGIGISRGDIGITLRVAHYSNCSIKSPNDGFETITLNFTQEFKWNKKI